MLYVTYFFRFLEVFFSFSASFFVSANSFSSSFILARGLELDKHKYIFFQLYLAEKRTIGVL